jgi:outer membrane protein assembly factor BamE (lipoprotein component of BamABCDE complex)
MPRKIKWILIGSILLNGVLVICLVYGVSRTSKPAAVVEYTKQDLTKGVQVSRGMTTDDVLRLLGSPVAKDIEKAGEEWHYCRTGTNVDEYLALSFEAGKVVRMNNYTVSWLDWVFAYTHTPTKELVEVNGFGDCKLGLRRGTYGMHGQTYASDDESGTHEERGSRVQRRPRGGSVE